MQFIIGKSAPTKLKTTSVYSHWLYFKSLALTFVVVLFDVYVHQFPTLQQLLDISDTISL